MHYEILQLGKVLDCEKCGQRLFLREILIHDMPMIIACCPVHGRISGQQTISMEARADLYTAFTQMAIHAQENRSATLNNFLVFNSILLVAWATSFINAASIVDSLVCLLLALAGVVICMQWEPLGDDYSNSGDLLSECSREIEKNFPTDLPQPLIGRLRQIERNDLLKPHMLLGVWPSSSSLRRLMNDVPRIFFVMYCIFMLVSFLPSYENWWKVFVKVASIVKLFAER